MGILHNVTISSWSRGLASQRGALFDPIQGSVRALLGHVGVYA